MALAIAFILGIGNFAWHRAVLESKHPMVRDMTTGALQAMRVFSLVLEFVLLCGALYAARAGQSHWVWAYLAYSVINGGAAFAIVRGRV